LIIIETIANNRILAMSTITDLPSDQRPREKLLTQGATALSDAELLAIFLRVGVKGKNAIELAQDLINAFGDLPALLTADHDTFCAHHGLGDAKYAQLQAVLEMARRHYMAQLKEGALLTSTKAAVAVLTDKLAHETREVICALFLDSKHRLISLDIMSTGSLREAPIYPREIAKRALEHNAAALILAHNHPSGDPTPSQADNDVTRQLAHALKPLDIRVLDHIIIGRGLRYTSLAELGIL
jgi:DNA repair protein RadC